MRKFVNALVFLLIGTATFAASKVNWNQVVTDNKSPRTLEQRLNLGVAYANLGKIEESAAQFDVLANTNYEVFAREVISKTQSRLAKNKNDILALNNLAFAHYARNEFSKSREHFRTLVSIDSQNVWSHNYLAIVYGKLGQIDTGIAQLKKSLTIEPNNEYTHLLLGMAYTEKKQYGTAAKHFLKAPRAMKTILKLSR